MTPGLDYLMSAGLATLRVRRGGEGLAMSTRRSLQSGCWRYQNSWQARDTYLGVIFGHLVATKWRKHIAAGVSPMAVTLVFVSR